MEADKLTHMKDIPPKVLETFERMKESEEGCIELKKIRGRYYVYRATSEWDKEDKKVKKITVLAPLCNPTHIIQILN